MIFTKKTLSENLVFKYIEKDSFYVNEFYPYTQNNEISIYFKNHHIAMLIFYGFLRYNYPNSYQKNKSQISCCHWQILQTMNQGKTQEIRQKWYAQ